jgi:hypothetical protein
MGHNISYLLILRVSIIQSRNKSCIKFGIPMTLVRLIEMCLNETYSKVRIGKNLSDILVFRMGLEKEMTCHNFFSTFL